jgi:5'-3' exonuclease
MELLSAKVEYAFSRSSYHCGAKTVIVSAANIAGEGEHKMFQYMRDHALQSETIAVYGLDSDLIMLSLFHCFACENIYIFREAPAFSHSILPKEMNVSANDLLCLNHRKLAECILKEMGTTLRDQHRIYDYIFMCFFLGNDFLPHFPALNIRTHGIYTLLETYKGHIGMYADRGFIHPKTGHIQWKWVKLFLCEIAKQEHANLMAEYVARDKMGRRKFPEKTPEDRAVLFDNIPVLYRSEEMYICPEERGWEDRYYEMAFADEALVSKKELCIHYLEGLEWVFRYYTEGCPHWRWSYKYHYPPLLKDLVEFVPDFETHFIDSTFGINRPFHPHVQLSYVIPPWNHDMLPANARRVVEKYPELFVPMESLQFQWMFCRYFWESHARLKPIPLSLMEEWDSYM